MNAMSTTLKNIADVTGFSVNTVSRALRGSSEISAKTTEYICGVANSMGYVANGVAMSLRAGKTRTIAVIIGCIFNSHFSIMIKGIEESATKDNYTVIIMNTNENEETEKNAIKTAASKKVDGIIICPTQKSEKNIYLLKSSGIPFVLIGRHYKSLDTNFVICDDYEGGKCAASYLLAKGRKNIFVIVPPAYVSSSEERLSGFIDAHKEYGRRVRRGNIIRTDDIMAPLKDTLDGCREAIMKADAVVCFSDMMACELIYWLRTNGITIPGVPDIIGFDDIQSRIVMPIRIKSIRSHKALMSHKAYSVLKSNIDNPGIPSEHIVIPADLSDGETA